MTCAGGGQVVHDHDPAQQGPDHHGDVGVAAAQGRRRCRAPRRGDPARAGPGARPASKRVQWLEGGATGPGLLEHGDRRLGIAPALDHDILEVPAKGDLDRRVVGGIRPRSARRPCPGCHPACHRGAACITCADAAWRPVPSSCTRWSTASRLLAWPRRRSASARRVGGGCDGLALGGGRRGEFGQAGIERGDGLVRSVVLGLEGGRARRQLVDAGRRGRCASRATRSLSVAAHSCFCSIRALPLGEIAGGAFLLADGAGQIGGLLFERRPASGDRRARRPASSATRRARIRPRR